MSAQTELMNVSSSTTAVLVADAQNAGPARVAAFQLSQNFSGPTVVLSQGWPSKELRVWERCLPRVEVLDITLVAGQLPRGYDHISQATHARSLIPDILSDRLSAIYFDADTFLRKPVSAGDFSGSDSAFGTAGVRDSEIPFIGCDHTLIPFRSKFGLCLNANAINAGVLRMDLRVWREEALGPRILEATERFNLRGNSALNAVVNGSVSLLPIWLNATVHMMRPTSRVFGWEDHDEVMRARNDPALVHFTGAVKPWHSNSRLPFTEEWRAVAREVEWTVSKHSFTYRRRIARAIANRFDSAFRG